MATKDVHTLLPSPPTCEDIASLGKRGFADVIEVKNFDVDYPGGPKLIIGILKSREPFLLCQSHVTTDDLSERCNISGFEDEGSRA